jgi:hypothetical protein
MKQTTGHFPNPRGVDLERVSASVTWGLSLVQILLFTNFVTNLTKDMDQILTRASYRQPTLTQVDFVGGGRTHPPSNASGLAAVHVWSGCIVFQFKDMLKKRPPNYVTPSNQAKLAALELLSPFLTILSRELI